MAAATAIDRRLWVEDDVAVRCHGCAQEFGTIMCRRHHCRRCGMAFCAECSPDTYPLLSSHVYGQVLEERVCKKCCTALHNEKGKAHGSTRSGGAEPAPAGAERQGGQNRHWERDVLGQPRSAATDGPALERAEAAAAAERQRRAAKLERDRRAAARVEAERVRLDGRVPDGSGGGSSAGSYIEDRDEDVNDVISHLQELQADGAPEAAAQGQQLALAPPSKSQQRQVVRLDDGGVEVVFIAEGPLGISLGGKLDAARPSVIEIIPDTIADTVKDLQLGMVLWAVQDQPIGGEAGLDFGGAMDAIRKAGRPLRLLFRPGAKRTKSTKSKKSSSKALAVLAEPEPEPEPEQRASGGSKQKKKKSKTKPKSSKDGKAPPPPPDSPPPSDDDLPGAETAARKSGKKGGAAAAPPPPDWAPDEETKILAESYQTTFAPGEAEKQMADLTARKKAAVAIEDFEEAAAIKRQQEALMTAVPALRWQAEQEQNLAEPEPEPEPEPEVVLENGGEPKDILIKIAPGEPAGEFTQAVATAA